MSDSKPTTVLVRIIGGEEYDECAPELLAEDVMPVFTDGVTWEIVRLSDAEARIAELEAALDEREVASGLTSDGNLWRYWADKAKSLALKNARLTAALAEAREDRYYWKVEAEGERAKVEFRDKRMFNFHAEEGELLFEIPRHIAVSIEPDGVGYTIFDAKAECWKAGQHEISKDIVNAGAEISAAIRALKEKP